MASEPSELTRLRRLPEKAVMDDEGIFAIVDASRLAHVGVVLDDVPVVLPTLVLRQGRTLLLHGSRSSRLLRAMLEAERLCVTVTVVDGLIVARSAFESSVAYRSAVLFGCAERIDDEAEKLAALDALTDGVIPGRTAELRRPSASELRRTTVLRFTIEEASGKVGDGWPTDEPSDVESPVWAGTVPLERRWGVPSPAPDGAVGRGEVDLPASIGRLGDIL